MSESNLPEATTPSPTPSDSPSPPPTKGWFNPSKKRRRGGIVLSETAFYNSLSLLPLVGYALLLFTIIDFVYLLVPPRLTDPIWQFEIMGGLVERIWAPLLGFVCIFYNRQEAISRWQIRRLRLLSWLALLMGLFYLFLLPLGVGNTWRIHQMNKVQVEDRITQQVAQVNQLRAQVKSATTRPQLDEVAQRINVQIESQSNDLSTYQRQLQTKINEVEGQVMDQIGVQWNQQKLALIKNSLKLNIGTILSGVWLILLWLRTQWARIRY